VRVVNLSERPKDDGVIDWIWVRLALAGSASAAAELTRRELVAAVHLGTTAGKTVAELADLLLIHARQVDRYRLEQQPTETFDAPKKPATVKTRRRRTEPNTTKAAGARPVYQQLELIAA
jgi:hypothetical protein